MGIIGISTYYWPKYLGIYILYETVFAKKTNNRTISGRKSPRLYTIMSLQCVLSGNQVVYLGDGIYI